MVNGWVEEIGIDSGPTRPSSVQRRFFGPRGAKGEKEAIREKTEDRG